MREGKARVIIGDTLSKCEALGRIEMLSFHTIKDFFVTPNSLHLCINLDVCRVISFFNPNSICLVLDSVVWANTALGNTFLFCLPCAMPMGNTKDIIVSSQTWPLPSWSLELNGIINNSYNRVQRLLGCQKHRVLRSTESPGPGVTGKGFPKEIEI